jgi:signal transduction histidine kinase
MRQLRQVLEQPTRIGAGQRMPSTGERVTPARFGAGERFAAYVAHELRTPLATQRALLEVALADPNPNLAGWREIAGDVLCACRRQERLLEACLTLGRSQGGPHQCEPLDLGGIAAEALRAHDPGELESVVALDPAWTSGDPNLVERLAANLVANAICHNIVGGRIEVATRIETGRAVLSVANTGPPIPASELERLFQPFQRRDSSPRSCSDGVGLGLAIVRAIADAHDATVTAQARTGGGLAIDVAFPAVDSRHRPTGQPEVALSSTFASESG